MGKTRAKNINPLQVWKLHDRGLSQRQIGDQIGATQQTVGYHLRKPRPQSLGGELIEAGAAVIGKSTSNGGIPLAHVSMSAEKVAGLSPAAEAAMIAGSINREGSLRKRIMMTLADAAGPLDDNGELVRVMRKADPNDNYGQHEVDHILKALKAQGLVRFRETRSGSRSWPERISLTRAGYEDIGQPPPSRAVGGAKLPAHVSRGNIDQARHRTDRTDFRTHRAVAEGGRIERDHLPATEAPPAPIILPRSRFAAAEAPTANAAATELEAVPEAQPDRVWPVLMVLRARSIEWDRARESAAKYLAAASQLEGLPGEESIVEALLGKAAELDTDPLTPAEREYVEYADACDR